MTLTEQELVAAINRKLDHIHETIPGNFVATVDPRAVEADLEKNVAVIRFESKEWMRNPRNTVHGGMLATMADMAMCAMGRAIVENFGPTIQMGIEYMRPVPVGSVVFVRVHCKKKGKKLLFLECIGVGEDDQDKPFFSANATFINDSP